MRRYAVLCYFWVPADTAAERTKKDRVPYLQWIRDGFLAATDGNVIDYDAIRARINELGEKFQIKEIAVDRWNSTQLSTQLAGDGLTMVPFGQGYASMAAPAREFDTLLRGRNFLHGGHPVLRWMAGNAAARQDPAGNIKPDKDKSSDKIDGIVAAIMAIGRASVHATAGSVYETRGVVVL